MNDNIPELKIERMDDSHGSLILLTQDNGGNVDSVAIHPIHLRYMAKEMGLVESVDPTAQKTIATLQRRMVLLRDRIDKLHHYLVNHSDHKHADLSYEVTYATACIDLADEFCVEFAPNDADETGVTPGAPPPIFSAEKKVEATSTLSKVVTVTTPARQQEIEA